MYNLSENYYLRKCYLEREQVPTQSMMRKKMSPALAAIYFKSMTPRLKEIAGLEPSLKGGGNDWYVPPEELLKGRAVLKPVKIEILTKLNHDGIGSLGEKIFRKHRKAMDLEIEKVLFEADINWRNTVQAGSAQEWEDLAVVAKEKNTEYLKNAFTYFSHLYRMSSDKFETLFHESAITEIKRTREKAIKEMKNKYVTALKYQAATLYDTYTKNLIEEQNRIKAEFINKYQINRADMGDKIHDLNVDKHMAIDKLRQFLKCQNIACQVYVALKEREECIKEMEESKHKHRKIVKVLTDNIAFQDVEIRLAEQKGRKRQEFHNIWKKKVCHVVKKFQDFVSYCLSMLPDYAEFFINMEKLMLLQVNEALENPTAESIIVIEKEEFHTPVPIAQPFYLFCDKGYKAHVNQNLCPKPSGSSMASQLPVIIINKKFLYAACDNFEQFTNRIKDFLYGNRGDQADIKDELIYEHFVPVKFTPSQQLLEIKLESSLLQVLQQEMACMNTEIPINQVPTDCNFYNWPQCPCTLTDAISGSNKTNQVIPPKTVSRGALSHTFLSKVMELKHETEPKWESFFAHVEPKKCACGKMAKKHLVESLPVYMRQMSHGLPEIPNYEMCSVSTLKTLVKEARKETPPAPLVQVPSKTKDIGTQCSDQEFEFMCTCFSDAEVRRLLSNFIIDPTVIDSSWGNECRVVTGNLSPTYMTEGADSFATARAYSLRNLVEDIPDLQEIFMKKDCTFE